MKLYFISDKWAHCTPSLPDNCTFLGEVLFGSLKGALVKYNNRGHGRGLYAIVRDGEVHQIDGRGLGKAVTGIGPPKLGVRPYTIKLTDAQAAHARVIGGGKRKLTHGIRKAIDQFLTTQQDA